MVYGMLYVYLGILVYGVWNVIWPFMYIYVSIVPVMLYVYLDIFIYDARDVPCISRYIFLCCLECYETIKVYFVQRNPIIPKHKNSWAYVLQTNHCIC